MTSQDLLFVGLAVWYVAYAFTSSAGPYRIFERIRNRLPLGGLTTCIKCLAVWAAMVVVALWFVCPVIVYPLSAAGLAIFIWRYTGGAHGS